MPCVPRGINGNVGPVPVFYPNNLMDNEMIEAEVTVRHAIRNAMTSTSDFTGLRAGPGCDRLVDAIIASLLDPSVIRAIRELALAKAQA